MCTHTRTQWTPGGALKRSCSPTFISWSSLERTLGEVPQNNHLHKLFSYTLWWRRRNNRYLRLQTLLWANCSNIQFHDLFSLFIIIFIIHYYFYYLFLFFIINKIQPCAIKFTFCNATQTDYLDSAERVVVSDATSSGKKSLRSLISRSVTPLSPDEIGLSHEFSKPRE